MLQWASRCVPGFSIIALLSLSLLAFTDIGYFLRLQNHPQYYGPPPPGHPHPSGSRPGSLPLPQKTFMCLSIFVHLNAFGFAIRLFFSLLYISKESKKVLQRRSVTGFKLLEDGEQDLGGDLALDVLQVNPSQEESKSFLDGKEVIHAIILPNYKEDIDTLRTTLQVLASHPRASSQYEVCCI